MKSFSIIVAVDEKFGIGKKNDLPWRLSADMQHFREITIAPLNRPRNVLIMGRKTWESLPPKFRPLPQRINAVVTGQSGFSLPDGVLRFSSLDAALDGDLGEGEVFVIGGAQVFAEAIKHSQCHKLYITHILKNHSCDVFFPRIPSAFEMTKKSEPLYEKGVSFFFSEYERRS
jgi:dihydrofolate reductase